MKISENNCVNCPDDMGCLGSSCPYADTLHYYCDDCEREEELYYFEGEELCVECILERLDKVEGSFIY